MRPANRRRCGVLGAALLLLSGGAAVVAGAALFGSAASTGQVALLGVAGALDLVAAVETPVTDRIAWYRLNGLGSVALGLSLPVGVAAWTGSGSTLLFAVTAAGGLALAALGADVCLFAGRHAYGSPLDATE